MSFGSRFYNEVNDFKRDYLKDIQQTSGEGYTYSKKQIKEDLIDLRKEINKTLRIMK